MRRTLLSALMRPAMAAKPLRMAPRVAPARLVSRQFAGWFHEALERPEYTEERTSPDDIECEFNEEGLRIATINGEEVVIPDLEMTLEFTLESPVDEHTFDEPPIIVEGDLTQ